MSQWFLEFLGVKEPPGAPIPPRGDPIKVPALYTTMQRRGQYVIVAYFLCVAFRALADKLFEMRGSSAFLWLLWGGFGILFAYFAYSLYVRSRWRTLRKQAKAADYLHCPTCGHDLRGGILKDSTSLVPVPELAAETDIVICPECGDSHTVKSLATVWELPWLP